MESDTTPDLTSSALRLEATLEAARAEVERHHEVIERWLTGRGPRTDLDAFTSAHTPDFTFVTPDGETLTMPHLLAMIEPAHGAAPALTIEIRNVTVVAEAGTVVVATYDEHHLGPDPRDRRATVVLVRDAAAPHGLRWRHLHETWIQQKPQVIHRAAPWTPPRGGPTGR
ncbi:nuclear transport factor 2 family protein [Nonomuraea sp. NPDC003727]